MPFWTNAMIMGSVVGGAALSFGNFYQIDSNTNASAMRIERLDDTHALAFWSYNSNTYRALLSVSGNTLSRVGGMNLVSNTSAYISSAGVSNSSSVIAYNSGSSLRARHLNPGPNSTGTELTVEASMSISNLEVTPLTSTTFLLTYGSSGNLYARILSLSGTTLTAGTRVLVSTSLPSATRMSACLIDTDTILLCFSDSANGFSGAVNAVILSVSGSTLTVENSDTYGSYTGGVISVDKISTTTALISYIDTDAQKIYAGVVSVSGTVPTIETPTLIAAAQSGGAAFLSGTDVIAVYSSASSSSPTTAAALSISGTSVTTGPTVDISTDTGYYIDICRLSDTQAIAIMQNTDQSNKVYGAVISF
jgi:hypothetical protein